MKYNGQNTLYWNVSNDFNFIDDLSDPCQVWPYLGSKGFLNWRVITNAENEVLWTPLSHDNPYVEIKQQAKFAAEFFTINGTVDLIISFVVPKLVLKHSFEGWIWAINRPASLGWVVRS
jgi:hypothetical protein